ncbi:hypothetical protein ABPG75_008672 [Micractinium tetrahymenae]
MLQLRPSEGQLAVLLGAVQQYVLRCAAQQQAQQQAVHQLSRHGGLEPATGFNVVNATQVVQAAAKLMDVQTTLAPGPAADPFNMYYDGQLLDAVLDFVVAEQPDVRAVAHIVGALGTLRHVPQPSVWHDLAAQEADLKHTQWQGSTSQFKWALAAAVRQLAAGQDVQSAFIAADCDGQPLALVDVALPQLRIVVDGVGPTRILRGHSNRHAGQLQLDGPTQARNRLLQGAGWLVVSVPYALACDPMWEGSARPSHKQLVEGLVQYLRERTGLLAAMREQSAAAGSAA